MADKNLNNFDLTKDLSSKDRATVARNLMYIERMKNNMSPTSTNNNAAAAAEERRIAQEREASERRITQEREESERRMLREREESERRITEEQERRARLEVEQEERLERMRAIAEAESYDRQLDFEQERMHKRMAVSYKYYDRNFELHYYYDDRGDYIDTAAARSLWQRIHCESYTTYDPADTFWEFFLDDKGNVITRAQAFELWQLLNCPDYLSYREDAVWTKYRCGDGYISAEEACKRWLTECEGTEEVTAYHVGKKTLQIAETAASGTVPLPDIGDDKPFGILLEEQKKLNTKKDENMAPYGLALIAFCVFILLFIVSAAIYDLKGKGPYPSTSYWAQRSTWKSFLKWVCITGSLTLIFYAAGRYSCSRLQNAFDKKKSKLEKCSKNFYAAYGILEQTNDTVIDYTDYIPRHKTNAKELALIYNGEYEVFHDYMIPNLPVDYVECLSIDYYETTLSFGHELLSKPCNIKLARTLCILAQKKNSPVTEDTVSSYINRKGKHTLTLSYLRQSSAKKVAKLFEELGVDAKITQKSVDIFKKSNLY